MRVFVSRLRGFLFPRRYDARLSLEIQEHLDALTDEYMARGRPAAEARQAARRAFGGLEQVRLLHQEQRSLPVLDALLVDFRYTLRVLARERALTAGIVLMLGLALAVNTALFTIINGMTWRGLPVDGGEQIMEIRSQQLEGRPRGLPTSLTDFRTWQSATRTFGALAAYAGATATLADAGHPADRVGATYVSANAFSALRVNPVLGRSFADADDRAADVPVVIIGHHIWTARYASDPEIVGRTIRVNGVPTTVTGVMPERFRFPVQADIWLPLGALPGLAAAPERRQLAVFGRLQDDATLEQARAEFTTLTAAIAAEHPASNRGIGARIVPFTYGYVAPLAESPEPLLGLTAAIIVLLIACANAANLLLARMGARTREVAMRSALGSSRARVVRQLLIEALLLSVGASLLGLALSVAGVRLFARETIDLNLPYWIAFEFDARVFSYVALVCVATAVVFGLAPAWQLSRTDAGEILKEGARGAIGGRNARRWSAALLVGELALTMMLLAAAGQLARNGFSLYRSDAQLDLDGLLAASLALPPARYEEPENLRRLQRQLQERLDGISLISSATLASARPFMGAATRRLVFAGETAEMGNPRLIESIGIGDRYFETLNLPLLRGRILSTAADAADREVVINARLAELFFHGADPIGQQIQLLEEAAASPSGRWLTIVGIVPSVRQRLIGPASAAAYTSLASNASGGIAVLLRGSSDSAWLAATLRQELLAIDIDIAAYSVVPLRRSSEISRFIPRFVSAILVTLGVIASVLSAGGLFGVTAMGISQRTAEVGLRMAVGARPVQIAWLFLRRTSILVCVGLAMGLAGALALNQTLQAAILGTRSTDAVVIAGAVLFLAVTAVVASLLPIRRATRLDPVAALRHE